MRSKEKSDVGHKVKLKKKNCKMHQRNYFGAFCSSEGLFSFFLLKVFI